MQWDWWESSLSHPKRRGDAMTKTNLSMQWRIPNPLALSLALCLFRRRRNQTMSLESSYPPPFRCHRPALGPSFHPDSAACLDYSRADPIPAVDLQFLGEEELREACMEWGLFRLVNHGVPPTLLTDLQEHAGRLFSLPFQAKQELFGSPLSYFWGTPALTPSGSPLGVGPGGDKVNWVEGLNVPLCQLPQLKAEDPVFASFRYWTEHPPPQYHMHTWQPKKKKVITVKMLFLK